MKIELILRTSSSIVAMDENQADISLQQAYENLFRQFLAVEIQLGKKIEELDNMHIKLAAINQQINGILLSCTEQVCLYVFIRVVYNANTLIIFSICLRDV